MRRLSQRGVSEEGYEERKRAAHGPLERIAVSQTMVAKFRRKRMLYAVDKGRIVLRDGATTWTRTMNNSSRGNYLLLFGFHIRVRCCITGARKAAHATGRAKRPRRRDGQHSGRSFYT